MKIEEERGAEPMLPSWLFWDENKSGVTHLRARGGNHLGHARPDGSWYLHGDDDVPGVEGQAGGKGALLAAARNRYNW